MSLRAIAGSAWLGLGLLAGCHEPTVSVEPSEPAPARPVLVLDQDDEALLESLLADDPSDFHVARARLWRIGPARWSATGPELGPVPNAGPRGAALDQPVEVVVVDADDLRILLPLDDLDRGSRTPSWPAVRLVAHLQSGDLVSGLTRELQPTPWLTLAAGVWLTPREREANHLRVGWSDPACGFALELAIDAADFGPIHEPGPSGRASDEPEPTDKLELAPGTQLYADPEGREPTVRIGLDPAGESRAGSSQRITLVGERVGERVGKSARNKLQAIELRCHGITVNGYVAPTSLVERPGWFAVVESTIPPSSSCAQFEGTVLVPRATPLFEPNARDPELVGVVAAELELRARPSTDGWWQGCVPSPWGDLVVDFQLR